MEATKQRKLTKKQRGFVNDYADTGNGTKAALKNYDTTKANVAEVIASENLSKPIIQKALKELGFDSNNAKRVIAEIMNNEEEQAVNRLNAADKILKVNGDYAPEKHVNVNIPIPLLHELHNHNSNEEAGETL